MEKNIFYMNILKSVELNFSIICSELDFNTTLGINLVLFFENILGLKGKLKVVKSVYISKKKQLILCISLKMYSNFF